MQKAFLLITVTCLLLAVHAQQPKTYTIENLETKDGILPVKPYNEILKSLVNLQVRNNRSEAPVIKPNIIANNRQTESLVYYGNHAFFAGMYEAYANHHPFTLSPDMMWLLIAQGFAQHVAAHAEELRNKFVRFDGKTRLIVKNDRILLEDPNSPWEEVFADFTKQIGDNTGVDLINTLTPNFTTTTVVDKVAAQIAIMKSMENYFEYFEFTTICGIPKITLEGTTVDWQELLQKAKQLRKYDLGWWIDTITPLLEQFIQLSKGEFDRPFWRNMFKYHTEEEYGKPEIIDGWIIKFFPYDKDGKRNNLRFIKKIDDLPNEMVKVNLTYVLQNDVKADTVPLELWAGFTGIRQDKQTFGFRPETGWMVRTKDSSDKIANEMLAKIDSMELLQYGVIRVQMLPTGIFKMKHLEKLSVEFIGQIVIPDEIANMQIDYFDMTGLITDVGINRIRGLLPNTEFIINGNRYEPFAKAKK